MKSEDKAIIEQLFGDVLDVNFTIRKHFKRKFGIPIKVLHSDKGSIDQ